MEEIVVASHGSVLAILGPAQRQDIRASRELYAMNSSLNLVVLPQRQGLIVLEEQLVCIA